MTRSFTPTILLFLLLLTGCRTREHVTNVEHHRYVQIDTLRYNDTTRVSEYYKNDTLIIREQHIIYRDKVTEVGKTDTIVIRVQEKGQHSSSPYPLYLFFIIITLLTLLTAALIYLIRLKH